ncbi:MAG: hypothetical protein ABEK12_02010 [Candidatus Nanohaloarchaea archaeon]
MVLLEMVVELGDAAVDGVRLLQRRLHDLHERARQDLNPEILSRELRMSNHPASESEPGRI